MSAKIEYQWTNNKIPGVQAAIQAALMRGLVTAGEHILNVSNGQVPLEDGDLARSGVVSSSSASDLTVTVSYDTPYAVKQHEDLSLRHDPGRNAKYLSNACSSEAKMAGRLIARAVKSVVGD